MTRETFDKALDFTARAEAWAWKLGLPHTLLLSGGECTEHPDFVSFLEEVVRRAFQPILITNGMWLGDKALREAILRKEWPHLTVQVTNDARFYPTKPPRVEDPRITYVDSLTILMPLGRLARKKNPTASGLPMRKAPSSFNLRSLTRHLRSFDQALANIRARAVMGLSGHCTPTVSHEGYVMAGESRECFRIGTVDSSNEEITQALISMRCNNCGLVDNLSQEQKRAIGESVLYAGSE